MSDKLSKLYDLQSKVTASIGNPLLEEVAEALAEYIEMLEIHESIEATGEYQSKM